MKEVTFLPIFTNIYNIYKDLYLLKLEDRKAGNEVPRLNFKSRKAPEMIFKSSVYWIKETLGHRSKT